MKKFLSLMLFVLLSVSFASGQVLREAYDNNGSSSNSTETVLTVSNVSGGHFGKLYSAPVDDSIFAQPLYVPNVVINGTSHKVVYVATMSNSLYAFDADTLAILWHVNLGPAVTDHSSGQGIPTYGIMSTPCIDLSNNTIFVVSYSPENGVDAFRLHSIDITTGVDRLPAVLISGSFGSSVFNPEIQMQRPGLALAGGNVIIAFGSYGDAGQYNGWVFSFSESLSLTAIFNDDPDPTHDTQGGIWQSGRAPVVDPSGNIYFQIGNGFYDGVTEFGQTFLKLSPTLQVEDWMVPSDYSQLNSIDSDIGSSGPLLIPGTNILVGGGKQGILFLTDTSNMGKVWSGGSNIIGTLPSRGTGVFSGGYFNGGAFFNNTFYIWPNGLSLSAYPFNGSTLVNTPGTSTVVATQGSFSAAIAISSNNGATGSSILWASMPSTTNTFAGNQDPAILRALDLSSLNEIWNSGTDRWLWSKFREPLIVNGRVYLGSTATQGIPGASLLVYGLQQATPNPPTNLQSTVQ